MGGIHWLFGVVLAGFPVRGACRGLLVESLAFFGLLASADPPRRPPVPGVRPA